MRLRIVTLNVWGLPPPIGHDVGERIDRILARLPAFEPDVVVLQEVWTEEAREQLVGGGRSLGFPHVWHRRAARSGSGLLVLSRVPIRKTRFTPYTLAGLPHRIDHLDFYGRKGFAALQMAPSDGPPFVLFATHMQARYAPRRLDEYLGHRTAQAVELAAAIAPVDAPVVAAGDFNFAEGSAEYRVLVGLSGVEDAAAVLDARAPTATLDNVYRRSRGASNESRIDYVFFRPGTAVGVRAEATRRVFDRAIEVAGQPGAYSDHAGVLAELEIGGPGRPPPEPAPAALAEAEAVLARGRRWAIDRQTQQRAGAGLGLGVVLGAGGFLRRLSASTPISRRRLLRTGLWSVLAGSSIGALAFAALSEGFAPDEIAGYDRVETLVGKLPLSTVRRHGAGSEAGFATVDS